MRIEMNHMIEFLCFLVAVFNYSYLKNTRYFYFIPFLLFVLFAELGASYINYGLHKGVNHIYLWISIFETTFYSYLFYGQIRNPFIKQLIIALATAIVCFFLFVFFFFLEYGIYYYGLVGVSCYLTFLCCVNLYELFIHSSIEDNIVLLPDFWIVTGIVAFFAGISITFVMHEPLRRANIIVFNLPLHNFIPQVLSIILYSCFSVAFILCRKKKMI